MAEKYEVNASTRRIARVTSWLARRGVGRTEILTTTGRKSGRPRTVPVSPIELNGSEYVVSPYGEVGWVHNARADSSVVLRHGRRERRVRLNEVRGEEAASVVAAYHAREGYARRYMDVPEDPELADFLEAVFRFPVFEVIAGS